MAFGRCYTEKELIIKRIEAQEKKDFYILSRLIKDTFETIEGVTDVKLKQTEMYAHYDVIMTFKENGVNRRWAFELKERKKDWQQCLDYPNDVLKVKKYDFIKKATHGFKDFDRVIYMTFLNESRVYMYDLKTLDMSNCKLTLMPQRKVQVNENSPIVKIPMYEIPYTKAVVFKDIDKYFKDYANYLQTSKEERQ